MPKSLTSLILGLTATQVRFNARNSSISSIWFGLSIDKKDNPEAHLGSVYDYGKGGGSNNAGPHNSDIANKLDPRVDSKLQDDNDDKNFDLKAGSNNANGLRRGVDSKDYAVT